MAGSERSRQNITRVLSEIRRGDPRASEELLPLVYTELRKLARRRMAKEKPGSTLQPTALVHEAYLRLVEGKPQEWDSRGHFFAAAAEAMRRILIERARRRGRLKRGGDLRRVSLADDITVEAPHYEELLALDRALERLEGLDPQMAKVVKLRYFAGLTNEEVAQAIHISTRSVDRLWVSAKAWLHRALAQDSRAR